MPIPVTGTVSLSAIRTELGGSGPISLGDTNVRRLTNATSGSVGMSAARGAAWIGATVTNLVLATLLSPAVASTYRVTVAPGVSVGATAGNTALTVGQFPTGSTIEINNYGSILGAGGAGGSGGAGSSGGDAINANYANQTAVINNYSGGLIYGGGGGGGKGGNGGTGGTGGGGQYAQAQYLGVSNVITYSCNGSCEQQYGGGAYCGTQNCGVYNPPYGGPTYYTCGPNCYRNNTINTNGGAGGGGSGGGNGGRGQGYDGANASGATGSAGSAGSAGGTNAGTGGTGGNGGTGGTGGTWGVNGNSGSTGATGATGANGNRTGGSAGSAGAGGSSGGAAGRYLVKGANSVTLNNSGTLAGGLA